MVKLTIPKLNISIQNFLRQCGYIEIQNPHKNNEISYARGLNPGRFYPRFHLYLKEILGGTEANLHLDAKKPSYEGTAAHGGEYSGEIVKQEAKRVAKIAERFKSEIPTGQSIGFQPKKSWWEKLVKFFKK